MDFLLLVSLIGSAAFALSGYMVGVRKELDIMGIFIVAMLTANGGGAVRDVLLGQTPAVLSDVNAFYLVIAVLIGAALLKLHNNKTVDNHSLFVISDSIGLVAFAITGALMGIDADLSIFGVMVLAFITATGGGILRDVLINEMPTLLKSDIYGSVALLAAASLYTLDHFNLANQLSIMAVFLAALLLRLLAYRYSWRLPKLY